MALTSRPSSSPTKGVLKRGMSQTLGRQSNVLKKNNQPATQTPTISHVKMTADIANMLEIKSKIDEIFALSNKVIKDNETTPDVEKILGPTLNTIKQSHSTFHKAGTQYFVNFATMQESAKTNQVLSSASVRIARETFTQDWKMFSNTIDSLTSSHPPPHSKEIIAKFQAVRSSMDYIKNTNENRKYPAKHLSKYITNIQSLCDNLCTNVIDVFTQPSFPNFETDLLTSYITNVKSFLGIINNAFSNDFLQSGVMLFDLSRVKANIFADCNEIILSLKSAFAFPVTMGEIKTLKDEVNVLIQEAIEKLSIPFAVVKPNGAVASQQIASEERKRSINQIEEEIAEDMQPIIPPKIDEYSDAVKKVRTFVKSIESIIHCKHIYTGNVWDDITEALDQIKIFKQFSDDQAQQIRNLENKINQLNDNDSTKEILYTSRKEVLQNQLKEQLNRYTVLQNEFCAFRTKYDDLQAAYHEKDKNLKFLRESGDAVLLKSGLMDIGKSFLDDDEELNIPYDISEKDLIEKIKELKENYVNKECKYCSQYKNMISNMTCIIKGITNTQDDEPMKVLDSLKITVSNLKNELNSLCRMNSLMKKSLTKSLNILERQNQNSNENDNETTHENNNISNRNNNTDICNKSNCSLSIGRMNGNTSMSQFSEKEDEKKLVSIFENEIGNFFKNRQNVENSFHKKEETYLKTLRQISSKLSKLLQDNKQEELKPMTTSVNEIRNQILDVISSQLRSLRDNLATNQNERNELKNKIDKLMKQREETIKCFSHAFGLIFKENSDEFLEVIIQQVVSINSKLSEDARNFKNKTNSLKNDIAAINTRLIGVSGNTSNTNISSTDEIVKLIYKNIEIIQDQKEDLIQKSRINEETPFKQCFWSILFKNDPTAKEKDYSNEELIEKVINIIEEKGKMKDYFPISTLLDIFDPVFLKCELFKTNNQQNQNSYNSDKNENLILIDANHNLLAENPFICLQNLSKALQSYINTLISIRTLGNDVGLVFRSFDGTYDSIDPNSESFPAFQERVHTLQASLDRIAPKVSDGNLLKILYKFASYTIRSVDFIGLQKVIYNSNSE
ncbi:hypothetical protein TRFO_41383 [Tritrichomonas foetus]|uniref:Uncharacterized protein n=1 Tax=Tritrichomonas foetus TaxID=1144522 RepID=A0A1J4L0F2_9EUKA|nr:hypothetical protein TRFO_41383 [Tritrichomonas foetus]|eukprot:OHT16993.1 hypothetical protein TRFO_41383 [Tritrichomonas foetus]